MSVCQLSWVSAAAVHVARATWAVTWPPASIPILLVQEVCATSASPMCVSQIAKASQMALDICLCTVNVSPQHLTFHCTPRSQYIYWSLESKTNDKMKKSVGNDLHSEVFCFSSMIIEGAWVTNLHQTWKFFW